MNVTLILQCTPPSAFEAIKLTPELQAAALARYSRSNEGIEAILEKIDRNDPEASVDRIFKFTDYGHASIGGLTGSITMAIDGVTMFLAFKLFELARYADGQESSTRYIKLDESGLPDWEALGCPEQHVLRVKRHAEAGLKLYQAFYARLDEFATKNPDKIRYPEGASDAMKTRIQKNFALDRARNFLPFALSTNVALCMTARAWCDVIAGLLSMPWIEARRLGDALRAKLALVAPRLVKHARVKQGWMRDQADVEEPPAAIFGSGKCAIGAHVDIGFSEGLLLPETLLAVRENRYDRYARALRRTPARLVIPRLAIAELRDLNRHRTGESQNWLFHPNGFDAPAELKLFPELAPLVQSFMENQQGILADLSESPEQADQGSETAAFLPYTYPLGLTVPYLHTMTLDKLVYMIELRTGPGAHFRYADHMRRAHHSLGLTAAAPLMDSIQVGQAEPE